MLILIISTLLFSGCSPDSKKATLEYIEITNLPAKLEYFEGELLNLDGLVVTATYDDQSSKVVSNYTVDIDCPLTIQTNTINVYYTENSITKSTLFSVQVKTVELTRFYIDTLPTKLEYNVGDELNASGMVCKADFNTGETKTITDYTLSKTENLALDDNSITVSYFYKNAMFTDSFDINVVDPIVKKYEFNQLFPDEVPSIYLTTEGTEWATRYNRNDKLANKINYVAATVSTTCSNAKYNLTDTVASVKVRGNYTLDYPKKPIRIKFDKKQTMFGLNNGYKAKNWVLLADWKDLSMLNNTTAFYLGKRILGSDGLYNSDYMNVNLYINNQYWGFYLLVEQQEVKDGRINITEAEDDSTLDLGYLFEFDGYYNLEDPANGGDYTFTINYGDLPLKAANGNNVSYSEVNKGYAIKSDTYSDAQRNQIKSFLNNAFKIAWYAMHENKFYELSADYSTLVESSETDPYKVISKYINVESWVDYYILSEIACDPDLGWSSMYMDCDLNKNNFKPLTFEALWDFDSAFGIRTICSSYKGLFAANKAHEHYNPWFVILNGCDWFMNLVKTKWIEISNVGVFNDALENIIAHKTKYKTYYEANYERWPQRITQGNNEVVSQLNKNHTEVDGADYLYNWLKNRIKELHTLFTGEILVDKEVQDAIDFANSSTKYRFELENANLFGGCAAKTGYNSSNNGYIGGFSGSSANYLTFNIIAPEETETVIYIGCSKRATAGNLNSWMTFNINGENKNLFDLAIPVCEQGLEWHDFDAFIACKVNLNEGTNLVKIVAKQDATNLDFIDCYSNINLTFSK